jgi:hypothetical protein
MLRLSAFFPGLPNVKTEMHAKKAYFVACAACWEESTVGQYKDTFFKMDPRKQNTITTHSDPDFLLLFSPLPPPPPQARDR